MTRVKLAYWSDLICQKKIFHNIILPAHLILLITFYILDDIRHTKFRLNVENRITYFKVDDRKIITTFASRCPISLVKYIKLYFFGGSSPDPAS